MRYITLVRAIRPAVPAGLQNLGLNSFWLLLARIVVQVQTLFLTILVARWFGEAAFGQYTLIASLIALGNVITSFGTDTLLIRQVAREGRASIDEVPAVIGLQVAFSTGFVALVWLWTAFLPSKSMVYALALRVYSLSLFPLALYSVTSAVLRGLERMELYLATSLATAGLQVVAVWLIIRSGGGLLGLMVALLAVQVLGVFASYTLCKRAAPDFSFHRRINLQPLVSLLRAAWPLAALSILGVISLRLGIFALSSLGTDAQTGLFSAAARVVEAVKLGHIAVLGALLPALSRLESSSHQTMAARSLLWKTLSSLLVLSSLGAAILLVFARPLVHLLYGVSFDAAVPALQILAGILIPYSVSSTLVVYLVSRKMEKFVTVALAVSLLFTAGLDIWWIPLWGIQGACLAAIIGESLQAGILWCMQGFIS
jgi:O-antigen/teichoic acid export membrane protein